MGDEENLMMHRCIKGLQAEIYGCWKGGTSQEGEWEFK